MNTLIDRIDNLLNSLTMYRLLIYILGGLVLLGLLFSLLGSLPLSAAGIALTTAIVLGVGYGSDLALAKLYRVPANIGSGLITSLILACILPPATTLSGGLAVGCAALIAVVSKYVLVYRRQHIINPAAAGAIGVGLLGLTQATWWIGNPTMLPFVLLGALLVIRKLRYEHLALAFTGAALATMLLVGLRYDAPMNETLVAAFVSWPLVFLASFMLTEPSTMPAGRKRQLWFGLFVGIIFSSQLSLGPVSTTPEIALAAGNILFFALQPKHRVRLRLKTVHTTGAVQDLEFEPEDWLSFKPGQYAELTLPANRADDRGNRRTFTIASSPTEPTVRFGVKYYEPSSTFKRRLRSLRAGDAIWAGQVNGDFTLPGNHKEKLLFIAGGVGITPFRSMAQYAVDKRESRDITLLYLTGNKSDVLYAPVFDRAAGQGFTTHYIVKKAGDALSSEEIEQLVPDIRERRIYIAGPNGMVKAYKRALKRAGLARQRVITDYFSGY